MDMNRRGFLGCLGVLPLVPSLKSTPPNPLPLTPEMLSRYFSKIEDHGLRVETIILSAIDTAPLFRREFFEHFDRETHREQLRILRIGHIWGADVRTSKRAVRPSTAQRPGEIMLIGISPRNFPYQMTFTLGDFNGQLTPVSWELQCALCGDPRSGTIDELLEG